MTPEEAWRATVEVDRPALNVEHERVESLLEKIEYAARCLHHRGNQPVVFLSN
mgnify:CR=1 FL=1